MTSTPPTVTCRSFGTLGLPGTTGNNTTLVPQSGSVIFGSPLNLSATTVVNQESGTLAGHFDTLFLDGTTKGNTIYGVIADNAGFTGSLSGGGYTPVTKQNSSQWILVGQQTYHGNTTISGGTLQLGNGTQDGVLDTTFPNGGLVNLSNNAALVYDLASGTTVAQYPINGAGSVTILAGGITSGTANTYSGATNIASGGSLTLASTASINSTSAITLGNASLLDVSQVPQPWPLNSGQTLKGTGSYLVSGTVNNATGSVILPGTLAASSAGTLTTGGLTLGGGTLSYEIGAGQDLINVTSSGGLNIGSATAINLFDSSGTNQYVLPGSFPLMDYNGALAGSTTNLTVGNPNPIDSYTFSTSSSVVYVNISGPSNVWTGNGSPFNWSVGGNWVGNMVPGNGASLGFFGAMGLSNTNDISNLSLSGIAFGTGAGAFNISGNSVQLSGAITNLGTATQTIGLGIQLTTGTQSIYATGGNIVLNGVLSDGGSGYGFHVNGPNAVVLGAANTYTSRTSVNSGTLSLANVNAVQNSTVSLASGGVLGFSPGITSPSVPALTGSGTVVLTTSAAEAVQLGVGATGLTSTFAGTMKGSGGLTKQGAGTFTLASAQTYGGPTVVSGGVLQVPAGLSGFGGNGTGWTLNSSNGTPPSVTSDVLQLTFSGGNSGRSAFYDLPVAVRGAFNASFVYQRAKRRQPGRRHRHRLAKRQRRHWRPRHWRQRIGLRRHHPQRGSPD